MTDPSETLWDRPMWLEGWRLVSGAIRPGQEEMLGVRQGAEGNRK